MNGLIRAGGVGALAALIFAGCGGGEEKAAPGGDSPAATQTKPASDAAAAQTTPTPAAEAAAPPVIKPSEPVDPNLETLVGIGKLTFGKDGTFEAAGWCLSPKTISAVEVTVNGNLLPPAKLGMARQDVAEKYPQYKNQKPGFSLRQNLAYLLEEGKTPKVRVEVISDLGEVLYSKTREVPLTD